MNLLSVWLADKGSDGYVAQTAVMQFTLKNTEEGLSNCCNIVRAYESLNKYYEKCWFESSAKSRGGRGEKKISFFFNRLKEWMKLAWKAKKFLDFQPELLLDFLKVTTWTSKTEQETFYLFFFPSLKMIFIHLKFKIIFHNVRVFTLLLQKHNFK